MTVFTVDLPGAFDSFFGGTGVAAGQGYSTDDDLERGARGLEAAYKTARRIRRGKGYALRLEISTVEGAAVLAAYADACLVTNAGADSYSRDHAEVAAARKVIDQVATATGGRVRHDGWNVLLDGQAIA